MLIFQNNSEKFGDRTIGIVKVSGSCDNEDARRFSSLLTDAIRMRASNSTHVIALPGVREGNMKKLAYSLGEVGEEYFKFRKRRLAVCEVTPELATHLNEFTAELVFYPDCATAARQEALRPSMPLNGEVLEVKQVGLGSCMLTIVIDDVATSWIEYELAAKHDLKAILSAKHR